VRTLLPGWSAQLGQTGDVSRVGILRCLVAAVLFGATAPLASRLAESVPAFTLAGLLYLGAAVAVLPSVASTPPTRRALMMEWRPALTAVVFGGALGPVLLMLGLARTSAATGSILLNTELAATVLIAALFFREHLGGWVWTSVAFVSAAGVLLTWEPGVGLDAGALLIVAACACWGLDNSVTASIDQLAPEHVVALKGVVAGGANLMIGLLVAGWGITTSFGDVTWALLIGATGYGLSITMWVKGARDLGAARAQVIFAAAPFIGAAIAWSVFQEGVSNRQVAAVAVAAVGVGFSLFSGHEHDHRHEEFVHDHEHVHDDGHHDHLHDDSFTGRHGHRHHHHERVHAHPHTPDLHHRHDH
jgi:drug/metabolite transporter (DMT)-like permease